MGQVSVSVNGRSYTITCDDGQETRIRRLAHYVDAKVGEFVGKVGQVGEARLLLLAALVIADELSDANDALDEGRERAVSTDSEPAAARGVARNGVDGPSKRAEAIAAERRAS
jgi:cell division protein ZapA